VAREFPDLAELQAIFYPRGGGLGAFTQVDEGEVPEPYRQLLAHDAHMTVTVERYHDTSVDVRVLEEKHVPPHYARKILLTRRSDGAVVLAGIMRIDLRFVTDAAREEILSRAKPLGRVLIEHGVLREVELVGLWRIEPGEELAGWCGGQPVPSAVYGRTALIHCHDEPAVELLEIITRV
jgi:chorismate-pyruvate lyase